MYLVLQLAIDTRSLDPLYKTFKLLFKKSSLCLAPYGNTYFPILVNTNVNHAIYI